MWGTGTVVVVDPDPAPEAAAGASVVGEAGAVPAAWVAWAAVGELMLWWVRVSANGTRKGRLAGGC